MQYIIGGLFVGWTLLATKYYDADVSVVLKLVINLIFFVSLLAILDFTKKYVKRD